MAEFINKEQFDLLKQHRYVTEGRSLLEEHVLRYFWDYIMRFIPEKWAPNSITLTGVVIMVVPFVALVLANPTGKRDDIDSYYYYAFAAGMFIFQTLDNLDGRQARRTNSCNALGEFFDHGCDTISDGCMTLSLLMALRIGTNLPLFLAMGIMIFPDYGFFWRAHWTGKYVFGDIDVSEIQWVIMTVLVISGYNPKIWQNTIFGVVTWQSVLSGVYFAFLLYYLCDVFTDAIRMALRRDCNSKDRQNVLKPMATLLLNMALTIATRYLAPQVYEQFPVCFFCIYILVLSKLSCRLLIANMTKQKMTLVDSSMLSYPILLLSNASLTPPALVIQPAAATFLAIAFASVDFVKYTVMICSQIADFLDIYCLTLDKPTTTPSVKQE